jgi:AhpD family alkylhydroperoxidase
MRTYRLTDFVRDTLSLSTRGASLAGVIARERVDPALREAVMVGVSRANDCRYCSFVHHRWALHAGLPAATLAHVEEGRLDALPEDMALAVRYGRALTASGFSGVDTSLEDEVRARFGEQGRRDLETVTRVITLANLTGNTFDALLARLKGQPVTDSSLVAELALTPTMLAAVPVVGSMLAAWDRSSLLTVLRDFLAFSRAFER